MSDLMNDAFYTKGVSNRGKISTIRQITEVIVRKILDQPPSRHMTLGKEDVKKKLNNPENHHELLIEAINHIKKFGNKCTHTQYVSEVSDEILNETIKQLFNLYSYIFLRFFRQHKFGENLEIMSMFSALPPMVRLTTLEALYKIDPTNVNTIDKLSLALVKVHDIDIAKSWVEKHKLELKGLGTDEIKRGSVGNHPDMYNLCLERVNRVGKKLEELGRLYVSFEEAAKLYSSQVPPLPSGRDDNESFTSLMDFAFLGRSRDEKLKFENIDKYFITE
jgi:hypothetical protein